MSALKTIDDKGRLTLGREYAGRQVQVEDRDGEVVLTFCRVVPEREAWLWENDPAIAMVKRGLEQAEQGDLTEGPDLVAAFDFVDSVPDDTE
ncbi:MAG: hypothetical protein H0W03_01935 [Solirubrobacterales bacterium]|jgi:hypothetical protein|nr:hypothetical protein [Solirubrobacterales bacterium]